MSVDTEKFVEKQNQEDGTHKDSGREPLCIPKYGYSDVVCHKRLFLNTTIRFYER
jgi:hypothetical protein